MRDASQVEPNSIVVLALPVRRIDSTGVPPGAAKANNRIAYAVGEPRDFKEVYRSSVPTWVNHWRYNWDTDVRLDSPAELVFVRFYGDPGLNTMRACLHLLPKEAPDTKVQVTHEYAIGGRVYRKTLDLAAPAGYAINCDGDPENISVTIAVPSN